MSATRTCRICGASIPRAEYGDHKRTHLLSRPVRRSSNFKICQRCPRQPDGRPVLVPAARYSQHIDAHKAAKGTLRRPTTRAYRATRREFFRRAGGRCQSCGSPIGLTPADWQLHHRDGKAGNDDPSNLVALCTACHGRITTDLRVGL